MPSTNNNDNNTHSILCKQTNIHDDKNGHHIPYKLIFLLFILFIGCLFKTIFSFLRIPYTSVILLIGFLGGILLNIFTTDETFHTIINSSPDLLVAMFLPILIFESAYRIEYHAFMKSLYFILLLSICGYFISLLSISILNKYLFYFQHCTFVQCLILGIILSVTRPVTLMRPLDYGKTKRLNIILEGETVINTCLGVILFNATKTYAVNNHVLLANQFFQSTTLTLIGGIGLGMITGILEIISLPYFYDDPISEVTITITIPYILYWLCEQLHCSGVLAIAILGFILSHHKTAISSEVASFMEKFWDMLTLITNTMIYLFAAFALAELIKINLDEYFENKAIFIEIGLAILNYFLCYLIRFFVIIVLNFCTKFCRIYRLSWKESILITCGGFKGSICLILALDFASELQLVNHSLKFKYQILIHTIIIVFISSFINSIYSFLLKLLELTTMTQTKYLYTIQCIESLRILIKDKIHVLKRNKYLADAHWFFIEKNFAIENLHMPNVTNKEMPIINRDNQCQNCHRLLSIETNQSHYYDDLLEEGRIHIINIQKTSFWRQHRDYEISSQTVRILSSLCDFAIDIKGQYLTVDQLKYYYKPRTFDFIWNYLESFFEQIYKCTRNDWQQYQRIPQDSCRLFFYNILNHQRYNILMTIIILLNVTLACLRCIMNFSMRISIMFTIIQSICILIYCIEFMIKIYTYNLQIYFRAWIYYRIEFILLLIAIIECVFEYYYHFIDSTNIFSRIFSLMQILIILQILRLSRIVQQLSANLAGFFNRMANRYITLSLELCKACISSEDDVLSKLNYIIEINQIRDRFQHDSIERRNQFIEELTHIQHEHPNISASVKTKAVIQKLLNYSKTMIHHMTEKGLLGENEAHRISEDINKRLHTELVPSILHFPLPLHFFHIFPWLHDADVFEYVLSHLHAKSYSLNEYIYQTKDHAQTLMFLTCGYVEIIQSKQHYHDALSIEKYSKTDHETIESNDIDEQQQQQLCYQCRMSQRNSSNDESEQKHLNDSNDKNLLSYFNLDDTKSSRLLRSPGDLIGEIDLLNQRKYTETCKCLTNTLIWYLESKDFIDLLQRFDHLKILDKIWHYSALQIGETILYEYLNTLPYNATEQERLHIYGYLKSAFLIPESYLIENPIIYSSHELILIQGQLENILSSLVYTSPCFIQIEIGQNGLKLMNISQTKILVLRSNHRIQQDEFVRTNDLIDLSTHVIYDHKSAIYLPRTNSEQA